MTPKNSNTSNTLLLFGQGDPRPNVAKDMAKVLFPLTSLHGPAAVPPLDLQMSRRLCTENHRNKVKRR